MDDSRSDRTPMDIQKIAAFSHRNQGGNPAGVVISDQMPHESTMLSIAADIGFSETAFLTRLADGWRIRYFSPEIEVPFCGHATIASGAELGNRLGEGTYKLYLNNAEISVDVAESPSGQILASLQSPATMSSPAPQAFIDTALGLLNIDTSDINPDFPIRFASAGARHLILMLNERRTLAQMNYDFEQMKALMLSHDVVTVSLLWPESDQLIHSRNAFAAGGVFEDPATGAAAAALGGYLRDIDWQGSSRFEILQGEDMGSPSRLIVEYGPEPGAGVKVTGEARYL